MAVMIEGRALCRSGDCAIDSKQAASHILPPTEEDYLCVTDRSGTIPTSIFLMFLYFLLLFLFKRASTQGKAFESGNTQKVKG